MSPTTWREDSITLPDGRILAYRMRGTADGLPLFMMHGTPGSRHCLSDVDLLSQLPGLLLIVADRPGYGLSSPKAGRTLLDWAADVHELARHLRLPRYWVAGASGGAPHALACAFRYPDEVQAAYLLCSPAPAGLGASTSGMALSNRIGFFLIRGWPGLFNWIAASTAAACRRDPEGFLRKMAAHLPKSDQQFMASPLLRDAMVRDLREAYRQGHLGVVGDMTAQFATDAWGIRFSELRVPVLLWHGEDDTLAPVGMARALQGALPGSRLVVRPGAGHFLTEDTVVIQEMASHLRATAGGIPPMRAAP